MLLLLMGVRTEPTVQTLLIFHGELENSDFKSLLTFQGGYGSAADPYGAAAYGQGSSCTIIYLGLLCDLGWQARLFSAFYFSWYDGSIRGRCNHICFTALNVRSRWSHFFFILFSEAYAGSMMGYGAAPTPSVPTTTSEVVIVSYFLSPFFFPHSYVCVADYSSGWCYGTCYWKARIEHQWNSISIW
jgi:hypothetical protein